MTSLAVHTPSQLPPARFARVARNSSCAAPTPTHSATPSHTPAALSTPEPDAPIAPIAHRECIDVMQSLCHAGTRQIRISYELQGRAGAPVVVVAGGISAHRHLFASEAFAEAGWWEGVAGDGLALDPSRFRLLAIDWLGADGCLDVAIDSADQADAIAAVLDHLQVARIAAFVGCSYGAMVGLQFAARYPQRIETLVAISGADRAHPYSSAWRAVQRRIAGLGRSEGGSREALSLARQLAMLSYRTPEEFALRFDAPVQLVDGRARCAAEDYLDACGSKYVAKTPLTAFLRLSESIDLHAVAAGSVTVPTVLVGVHEDRLVPSQGLVDLAEALPSLRRLHLIRSRFGHDAFLKEPAAINAIIRKSLSNCAGVEA